MYPDRLTLTFEDNCLQIRSLLLGEVIKLPQGDLPKHLNAEERELDVNGVTVTLNNEEVEFIQSKF